MLVLAGTNTAQLQCQLDPVRHNGPVGTGVRSQVCHTVSHIPALATKINICRDNRIIKQSHTLFDGFLSGPLFIRLFLLCHWLDWVKIFFCRKESDNVWSHRTYFLQIPDYHLRSECQAVPGMWYELCARCNISPHYRMSSPSRLPRVAASCLSVVRCEAGPHTDHTGHTPSPSHTATRERKPTRARAVS